MRNELQQSHADLDNATENRKEASLHTNTVMNSFNKSFNLMWIC